MRIGLLFALFMGLAGVAAAEDVGRQAPDKTPRSFPLSVPDPARQGGDTIANATVIPAIPYTDTGTTAGYANDYDEVCPYTFSAAPEVVYMYVAGETQAVTIDLCGSEYDTKVYVYDAELNSIACNDDFYTGEPCGQYVSKLENVPLVAGMTYYIFVDGYTHESGPYILEISPFAPCELVCPADSFAEGEPPLVDDYVDQWNGGCSTTVNPFQSIYGDSAGEAILCGVSGWYDFEGSPYRDTDWFLLTMGQGDGIEIVADAEFATHAFELGPQDCAAVGVIQQATGGPCVEASMAISGYAPGAPVWFWVGPTTFYPPAGGDDEYDYVVWFAGLQPVVATEGTTWSTMKALYE